MKILYCSPGVDTEDLKRQPTTYTSSKIKTLQAKKKPFYIKEFQSVKNMDYIELKPAPRFSKLWLDVMNNRTFSYNFEYLNSKCIFDEYVKYNREVADSINAQCADNDLIIVNDESLYLLPEMVTCRVAIRNLKFSLSFIEKVPYYLKVLESLFKAQKFFADRESLEAFNTYVDSLYEFWDKERGGCWYMKTPVDKERVQWVIQACYAHLSGKDLLPKCQCEESNCGCTLPTEHAEELREKVANYIAALQSSASSKTVLTNAPLLHLEMYIKHNKKAAIRYLRDKVEMDEEKERMVQYLKKTYDCTIEIVDTYDFEMIVLEMLHCDVFVGNKYYELAKMLRRPHVLDNYDLIELQHNIERCIGQIRKRQLVHGEDEYLKAFMEINGYRVQPPEIESWDDTVDSMIVDYLSRRNEGLKDLGCCKDSCKDSCKSNCKDNGKNSCKCNGKCNCKDSCKSNGKGSCKCNTNNSISSVHNSLSNCSISSSSSSSSSSYSSCGNEEGILCECTCHTCKCTRGALYEKIVKGEKVLFKRVCEAPGSCANCKECSISCKECTNPERVRVSEVLSIATEDEPESQKCPDERNCYCNNGKHYDDGKGTICDCGQGRAPRKPRLNPASERMELKEAPQADLEKIKAAWDNSNRVALLDYDGTLSELCSKPEEARPSQYILDLLGRLSQHNRCVVCTGRSCADVDAWFPPELEVYAEHGAQHRVNGEWEKCHPVPRLDECREIMQFYAEKTPGSMIEDKESGCAFHFKNVPEFDFRRLFCLLRRVVGDSVYLGKYVLEVRSGSKDIVSQKVKPAFCAGDDQTDEDMFAYCEGVSVKVGEGKTIANYSVKSVSEMIEIVEYILK